MALRSKRAACLATAVLAIALGAAPAASATIVVPALDAPAQITGSFTSDGAGPEVARDGDRFFVVWHLGETVLGAFLSDDGAVLSPGVITIASSAGWRPSISDDGTNFLVAWRGPANGGEVLAKRVDRSGTVLDADPIVVAADVKQRRISVAFDGTRHLAVWRTEGDAIRGARVSTAGQALDGSAGFAIGAGFYPWVESASGKFLVVWHGHGAQGLDIFGSLVTNGTPAAPFTIAEEATDQDHSAVAENDTDYMVAFQDGRFGDSQNFSGTSAVRVTGAGAVLDPEPIKVSENEWSQGAHPTVAWDGTDWVVAWPEDKPQVKHRVVDTYLRRVSVAGAIVDLDPVPIGTGYFHQIDPTLAVAGDRYLAVLGDLGRCVYGYTCLNAWVLDRVPGSPPVPPAAGAPHVELGTWVSQTVPTDEAVHGVAALSDDLAYASTEEAGIDFDQNPLLRWNGTGWSVAEIQPNARKWGISAPAENWVFTAGGAGGSSVHWDGTTPTLGAGPFLTETETFLGQSTAILGFGPWHTFSAGAGAVARHIGPDLSTWGPASCQTVDGEPFLSYGTFDCDHIRPSLVNHDLAGTEPDDVHVAGEHATLAHFDGTDWDLVAGLPTQQSLNGLYQSCAGDLFAVGDFGTILRRQSGAWMRMGSPTEQHLTAVAGFSPTDVYAVGHAGAIIHFDGTSWSPEASGTDNTLEDVAVGGSTVWVVGSRQDEWAGDGPGTILRKQRTISDAAAPENPSLRSGTHPPGEWTAATAAVALLEGGCDDGRGIDGFSAGFDQSPDTVRPTTANLDAGTLSQQATLADGEHYFHLRTVDRAGNWSATSHLGPLRVDTLAPENPAVAVEHPAAGTWSADTRVAVSWSGAGDALSGVAGYSYSIDPFPSHEIDTVQDLGANATGVDETRDPGAWYFHLRTVDVAGNWSPTVHAGPFQLDDVPPTIPTATFRSELSHGNVLGVEIGGDSFDPLSGKDGYSFAFERDPAFTVDAVKDVEDPAGVVQSGPLEPGDWYFRVRAVDNAGNWSDASPAVGPMTVSAPPPAGGTTTPITGPAIVPPTVVQPFVAGVPVIRLLAVAGGRARRGSPVAFTVDVSAQSTLTLRILRRVSGRVRGGRCRADATRGRRCSRWRRVGPAREAPVAAGRSRQRLAVRRLRRGRHRLAAFATNGAGRSRTARAGFVVR